MEKRRRARINASLTELKTLLLDAIRREGTRQNKMEKADILEMAVRHIRQIQRHQYTGESSSNESSKYQQGFHACVQEVCKYLGSSCDEDVELKTKLLNHLVNCMTSSSYEVTPAALSTTLIPPDESVLQLPISPVSSSSPSSTTLSPQVKKCVLTENISESLTSVKSSGIPLWNVRGDKGNIKSSNAEKPLAKVELNAPDRTLHAVVTSSSIEVVNPRVSTSASRALFGAPSAATDSQFTIPTSGSGSSKTLSITEINNNSIIVPTYVNVPTSTSFTCLQQTNQLQPSHFYQQPYQITQSQLQAQLLPTLPDGSSMFTSANQVQLIPTKTTNGDIVFLLPASSIINPSHIPNLTIPVLAPSTAPILTSSIPQQAIQIAVSYPPEDQRQTITFISHPVQPSPSSANQNVEIIPTIPSIPHQTSPLNLSSTNHQPQTTRSQINNKPDSLPDSGHAQSVSKQLSVSPGTSQSAYLKGDNTSTVPIPSSSPYAGNTELSHQTRPQTFQGHVGTNSMSFNHLTTSTVFKPDLHLTNINRGELQPDRPSNVQLAAIRDMIFFRPWNE